MEYDMLVHISRGPQKNVFEISDVREETNKQTNKQKNRANQRKQSISITLKYLRQKNENTF